MLKSILSISLGILLIISLQATATVHEISVGDTFEPHGTSFAPGDTVRWILQSGTHQIVSDASSAKTFLSPEMSIVGETFEIVFHLSDGQNPFPYHCGYHPNVVDTIFPSDYCYVTGDINGNDTPYEISDAVLLANVVRLAAESPDHLYGADMNADCVIDDADLEIYIHIVQGDTLPPDSSTVTCCYPSRDIGACCLGDSCTMRSEANCAAIGGTFQGLGISCSSEPCTCCVLRGDLNHDGTIDIGDLTCFVENIFCVEPPCCDVICPEETDVNADGSVDIGDIVYLVEYMFLPGAPAPPPCASR